VWNAGEGGSQYIPQAQARARCQRSGRRTCDGVLLSWLQGASGGPHGRQRTGSNE
jgi:hypothetical protein